MWLWAEDLWACSKMDSEPGERSSDTGMHTDTNRSYLDQYLLHEQVFKSLDASRGTNEKSNYCIFHLK